MSLNENYRVDESKNYTHFKVNDSELKLKSILKLSMVQILEYECHSHWLAPYISFKWGQELLGKYIANKVNRKYRRYSYSLECRDKIING